MMPDREIITELAQAAGIQGDDLRIDRLSGLINANYKVSGPETCVVVRLAGAGTDAFLDRGAEVQNASLAARARVAPEVLYADEDRGIIVTRFVEDSTPLDAAQARRADNLVRIGKKLRQLHTECRRFASRFDPFHLFDRYLAIMQAHGHTPPNEHLAALRRLDSVRELLEIRRPAFVPCHGDLLPDNILDDGRSLFIIDYEFSGNCDPLWDLGDFSGEAELDEDQERTLLSSYFGGAVPSEACAVLIAYKALSCLLAAGWTRVQIARVIETQDFQAYGDLRLARCWDAIESLDLRRLDDDKGVWAAIGPLVPRPLELPLKGVPR